MKRRGVKARTHTAKTAKHRTHKKNATSTAPPPLLSLLSSFLSVVLLSCFLRELGEFLAPRPSRRVFFLSFFGVCVCHDSVFGVFLVLVFRFSDNPRLALFRFFTLNNGSPPKVYTPPPPPALVCVLCSVCDSKSPIQHHRRKLVCSSSSSSSSSTRTTLFGGKWTRPSHNKNSAVNARRRLRSSALLVFVSPSPCHSLLEFLVGSVLFSPNTPSLAPLSPTYKFFSPLLMNIPTLSLSLHNTQIILLLGTQKNNCEKNRINPIPPPPLLMLHKSPPSITAASATPPPPPPPAPRQPPPPLPRPHKGPTTPAHAPLPPPPAGRGRGWACSSSLGGGGGRTRPPAPRRRGPGSTCPRFPAPWPSPSWFGGVVVV